MVVTDARPDGSLARLASAFGPEWWEWAVAMGAEFILGRTPALFFRERLSLLFGGGAGALWMNDLAMQVTFAVVELGVIVTALRRAKPSALLRQQFLLLFLGFAWLSMAWSIEPQITLRHVLLIIGTAGVGWYIGDRFLPDQQALVAAGAATVGSALSAVALIVWPDIATRSLVARDLNKGWWSGIYLNRNLLAIVMAFGLLAIFVLFESSPHRRGLALLACPMALLLVASKARTAPVALAIAVVTTTCIHLLRRYGRKLTARGGALIALLVLAGAGVVIHFTWSGLVGLIGRDQTLTGRTAIWQIDRWLSSPRPWQGWGFEAIWSNKTVIKQSAAALGRYPYSAHNGYYEMLLSLGRVGLVLFVLFLAAAVWRAFRYAWPRRDLASLWPLAIIVFAVVVNFSESMFVASEALFVLVVAASVGATEYRRARV